MINNEKIEFSVKALIVKEGKFLALHRSTEISTLNELPGGRLEFGETAEQTVVKKVLEETNFSVEPIKLIDTWNFIKEKHQITGIIYLCKIKQGRFMLSYEHNNYEWLELNEESVSRMTFPFKERMKNWDMKSIMESSL
ncbi:NUDIX domain-containing protein [Clostridium polynesiense]|uniref:NUDIX domain-containing protein n=1 Tax=Clostridium polynesiense TaxID=1325933 RepID=UPI0005916766|nr:NUDIX domain-containing protein [Clostridium polynesiense]